MSNQATLTVIFTVPTTDDKCWTPDGVQCFMHNVLRLAYTQALQSLMRAQRDRNENMQRYFQSQIDVINSVSVNGVTLDG